ncbi:two-component system response regulator RppA [Leptolyngbya sp. AN02str]|jgi:DNA-binding response OmpR family regulator|uniref:Response regulator transcription factor n=1 Tax=Leptolyngbya sp. NK1-12 TaxID=2547451 RepID=A0AA96WMU5_9CYAN|nr:two-component system response regulator RppA [Leptolyngbya sp. NK1-12]PSB08877.1 DNA-binding response regulator [filamentous cyanobacterium CCP2]WNZ28119.1 response regulator transcription factor [Leptolyngbya sp. NK1-12]
MRILLVEDEYDLGAALERSLKREKYVVDWVKDGAEAWQFLENGWNQYTVAIFDWLLPGLSGIELCQRLRAKQNPLPVLMLTARDRMEDRVMGLDAGADDYLIKPFGMAELLARLRALQRRSLQIQPPQLQVGNLLLDYATSAVSISTHTGELQNIPLTAKEFQLLEYFMQHPNQILSRDQIIGRIWRAEADFNSNVVAAQMRLLRRKLTEYGYDQLIETVYGMGYKLNTHET